MRFVITYESEKSTPYLHPLKGDPFTLYPVCLECEINKPGSINLALNGFLIENKNRQNNPLQV